MNPNHYPQYWWHKLAHVCRRWRSIILNLPTRLGLTLICAPRTPVEDLLAHSPTVPIIIYYGNPEPYDLQDDIEAIRLALQRRDRVCRINLHLPSSSLSKVFEYMKGSFPVLETLQLYCSSLTNEKARLPDTFEAPKLRHLQLSDFTLVPQKTPPLNTTICPPSLVSFSLGEVTPTKYRSPALFLECLSVMPQLKSLKIGYLFSQDKRHDGQSSKQASHTILHLTNLEELQFHGRSDYFEALAARLTAPSLKELSLTFTDSLHDVTLPNLSELIRGAKDLSESCKFARVRFKDNTSIVMDQNELWTGRGAFELMFNWSSFEDQLKVVTHVCGKLPSASDVTSLLLEYARADKRPPSPPTSNNDRKMWHGLLGLFENVDTLRVANLVDELDNALQLDEDKGSSVRELLPKLKRIVLYGPLKEFKPFVEARKRANSDVKVESGPKNRLTLV